MASTHRFPDRAGALPPLEARVRRRRGRADHGRRRERRPVRGLSAQAQFLRPRRRHRAQRRRAAAALRAPRGEGGGAEIRQGPRVLRRRQHPHARGLLAYPQGQLLQVHQRDAQLHGGCERRLGPEVLCARCAARPPAAATSWRWQPITSCSPTTAARRWRCPSCRCWRCCRAPAGLTRVTDKRKVRRDLADAFCTIEEGVKGARAVKWRLVDQAAPNSKFEQAVKDAAGKLAAQSDRPGGAQRHRARLRSSAAIADDGDRLLEPQGRDRPRRRAAPR